MVVHLVHSRHTIADDQVNREDPRSLRAMGKCSRKHKLLMRMHAENFFVRDLQLWHSASQPGVDHYETRDRYADLTVARSQPELMDLRSMHDGALQPHSISILHAKCHQNIL